MSDALDHGGARLTGQGFDVGRGGGGVVGFGAWWMQQRRTRVFGDWVGKGCRRGQQMGC